ncbi:MAG: sarcosine oxidase subunit delta [Pseudomonadota bacterium]
MRWIEAPLLGRRPVTEFTINGVLEPEPEVIDDREPGQWVFERSSVPMIRTEWWYHAGAQLWFLVDRDTGSDEVIEVKLVRDID